METHPWPFGIPSRCPRAVPSPVSPQLCTSTIMYPALPTCPKNSHGEDPPRQRRLPGRWWELVTEPAPSPPQPLRGARRRAGGATRRLCHAGTDDVWHHGDGGVPHTPTQPHRHPQGSRFAGQPVPGFPLCQKCSHGDSNRSPCRPPAPWGPSSHPTQLSTPSVPSPLPKQSHGEGGGHGGAAETRRGAGGTHRFAGDPKSLAATSSGSLRRAAGSGSGKGAARRLIPPRGSGPVPPPRLVPASVPPPSPPRPTAAAAAARSLAPGVPKNAGVRFPAQIRPEQP